MIRDWCGQQIDIESSVGDEMQQRGASVELFHRSAGFLNELLDRGCFGAHKLFEHREQTWLNEQSPIATEQSQIRQQWSATQFNFGDDVKSPTALFCVASSDAQFALDIGPDQLRGRFDLDEMLPAIGHRHQEVGHDVGALAAFLP